MVNVCDKPYHTNNGIQQKWEEIKTLRNYALRSSGVLCNQNVLYCTMFVQMRFRNIRTNLNSRIYQFGYIKVFYVVYCCYFALVLAYSRYVNIAKSRAARIDSDISEMFSHSCHLILNVKNIYIHILEIS